MSIKSKNNRRKQRENPRRPSALERRTTTQNRQRTMGGIDDGSAPTSPSSSPFDSLSITEKNKNKKTKSKNPIIYLHLRKKVKVRFTRRNGEPESGRRMLLTNFNKSKVNIEKRDLLVDWLLEARTWFHLEELTAFASVDILDRFLSVQVVSSTKELHYLGVAAMHIASKYYETRKDITVKDTTVKDITVKYLSVSLDRLVYALYELRDPHAHNRYRAWSMERRILYGLGWELEVPTVFTFLTQFLNAAENPPDTTMEKMAYFYAKLGIWNHELAIDFHPSVLAAAAILAACAFTCKMSIWRNSYRGFKCTQLSECSKRMLEVHWENNDMKCNMKCNWWIPFK